MTREEITNNICIVDNSLITCTLIYRLLEERLPNAVIQYYLDPADLLLKELTCCDLMIIDEALINHSGTEVLGHLYDYILESEIDYSLADNFPQVLFSTSISTKSILKRLKQEKILDVVNYQIIKKPFHPGELETKVEQMLDVEPCPKSFLYTSNIPSSIMSFTTGFKSIFH